MLNFKGSQLEFYLPRVKLNGQKIKKAIKKIDQITLKDRTNISEDSL
jgi:hypothetical protein